MKPAASTAASSSSIPIAETAYDQLRDAVLTANPPRFEACRPNGKNISSGIRRPGSPGSARRALRFLRDDDAYDRARRALLDRFGTTTDPTIAERTSRACLLSPLQGDELERASTLADRAVAAGPGHESYHWFQFAKGLAEYRRNHFADAIRLLSRSAAKGISRLAPRPGNDRHRLGKAREARETLFAAPASYEWSGIAEHRAPRMDRSGAKARAER